jgi:YidC/Oxa1 family membrane protein insertase
VFISLFYMLRTDLKLDICGQQLRRFYSQQLGRHIVSNAQIPQNAVTVPGHSGKLPGLTEVGCSTPFHYNGALHTIAPGSAKFLFLPDITYKATGAALIVLILLYVGSQVASTLVATATADPNQRRLMLLLPVVFVVILYRYPAGLLVYWITTNLWTIGQQYLIKRHIGPPPAPQQASGESNGKPTRTLKPALAGVGGDGGPSSSGGGGLLGRLSGGSPPAPVPESKPAPPPPRPPRKKKKRSGRRR